MVSSGFVKGYFVVPSHGRELEYIFGMDASFIFALLGALIGLVAGYVIRQQFASRRVGSIEARLARMAAEAKTQAEE